MFVAQRHLEQRVITALHEQGHSDFTLAQARVAARIARDGTRLTDLAAGAQVTKQTAGFLVDQLEAAGYVERRPDPADGRARLVVLSRRGRAVQRKARAVEDQVEAEWAAHLGPRRTAALKDALVRLREVTDPFADQDD
jgi:DNA-binding MarR family transcriptional regulator